MTTKKILLTTAVALTLTGCVKDKIYNTDHPDRAKVTVTTDWSDRGTDVSKPTAYTITTTGVTDKATSDRHTLGKTLDPGPYRFLLYNTASSITVSDGTAAVATVPTPSGQTGTFVEPLPGWLFTGTAAASLEADRDYELTIPMHQQVRQLTFIIEPEGGAAGDITAINAILSGIAGTWNIAGNEPVGDPVNVVPVFTKVSDGNWSAAVRLLGITGNTQRLAGTVSVAGNADPVIFDSDLSQALSSFNTGKKNPLTLKSGVVVEPDPTQPGFTATIKGWEKVDGNSGTAW